MINNLIPIIQSVVIIKIWKLTLDMISIIEKFLEISKNILFQVVFLFIGKVIEVGLCLEKKKWTSENIGITVIQLHEFHSL